MSAVAEAGPPDAPDLAALLAADPVAQCHGIGLVEGAVGRVVLEMTVTDDQLNFLGGGHGGVVFTFADMAFGLASNAHGAVSVGIDAHIAYAKGVAAGDRLRAVAVETSRSSRLGVYRVDVQRGDDHVATFTGTVFVTDRPLDPPAA